MNNWLRAVTLSLVLLLFAASGCSGNQKSVTETETSATSTTGPAAGRTLLIATQNNTSHSDEVSSETVNTAAGPVEHYQDGPAVWEQEASDPRATGQIETVSQTNIRADMSGEVWGDWVLTNDGGTWDGTFFEVVSSETSEIPVTGYFRVDTKGTGKYAGLEMHLQGWSGQNIKGFEPGTDNVVTGWIEKAD